VVKIYLGLFLTVIKIENSALCSFYWIELVCDVTHQVHRQILNEVSFTPTEHLHEAVLGRCKVVVVGVELLVLVFRDEGLVVFHTALYRKALVLYLLVDSLDSGSCIVGRALVNESWVRL
jgi:hypothetical protein